MASTAKRFTICFKSRHLSCMPAINTIVHFCTGCFQGMSCNVLSEKRFQILLWKEVRALLHLITEIRNKNLFVKLVDYIR